jgi:4-diphosphocytidyl-2-C-methyl-D-erythritol kinase
MSGSAVRVHAYAKINLTLEILGRREDGYHNLRTVMQTVSLADELTLETHVDGRMGVAEPEFSQAVSSTVTGPPPPLSENLAQKAHGAFLAAVSAPGVRSGSSRISLDKRIPTAAGLGGGSSDGAAVLRAMNRLSGDPLGVEALEAIAATFGSDTAFFVRGGTQLAEGRGERLLALPDLPRTWLVLAPRSGGAERKTARLFSLLRSQDFSDGSRTEALVATLRAGRTLPPDLLFNGFERVEATAFPENEAARSALQHVCGHALLCGAGPSLFALADSEATARRWVDALRGEVHALALRTVPAAEASAVEMLTAPFAKPGDGIRSL